MSQGDKKQLFSRTQKVILLVLVLVLAIGLFAMKHRRNIAASDITITPGDASGYSLRLDINTASWQEIALVPGIGETKAKAIVSDRDKNGPFKSPNDLTRVSGIGEKTVAEMAKYLKEGEP